MQMLLNYFYCAAYRLWLINLREKKELYGFFFPIMLVESKMNVSVEQTRVHFLTRKPSLGKTL